MKRNMYLTILIFAAVICIVFGTLYHTGFIGRWNSRTAVAAEEENREKEDAEEAHKTNEDAEEAEDEDAETGKIPETETASAAAEEKTEGSEPSSVQKGDGTVTEIQAALGLGSLTIRTGGEFAYEYNGNEEYKPHVELEDGTLRIWQDKKNFKLISLANKKAELTVTVPEGTVLENAGIQTDLGDLELTGLTIENGSVGDDLGDIILSACELGKVEINADLGDVEVEECSFRDLKVKEDLGDVTISSSTDLKDAVVDLSTSLGSVKVNGQGQGTKHFMDGGGEISLYVRNDLGDVRLTY